MCEYIDRTGNLLSKDMKREMIRQAATLELENDKEKKMRHEVNAGVIGSILSHIRHYVSSFWPAK
jgi:hypothetical protein